MNIAFLSYEFPVETGGGGIGTYLKQITSLITERGHRATVFAGTKKNKPFWESPSVFRIPASGWKEFNEELPQYFIPIHNSESFDVVECTDFYGCGLYLKRQMPQLPVVVRLHTPLYMVDRLLFQPLQLFQRLRFILGSLRKAKWPHLPQAPLANNYSEEFELIQIAEKVSSPGLSIYNEMKNLGFQLDGKTEIIPLPFEIPGNYKSITSRKSIKNDPHIVYIGRLELRKGVTELANAIPVVLKRYPGARFTFVGESAISPQRNTGMMEYLKKKLKKHLGSVIFTGKVSGDDIVNYLSAGDIFVFPSYYESFGLACCEAMAAGKTVIGSNAGGMAEIIEDGQSGLLVKPKDHLMLASSMIKLIKDDSLRMNIGHGAEKRIMEYLNPFVILEKQLQCYQSAIDDVNARTSVRDFQPN